jgi:hypothetical protein
MKALELPSSREELSGKRIIIESDSTNVINWMPCELNRPLSLQLCLQIFFCFGFGKVVEVCLLKLSKEELSTNFLVSVFSNYHANNNPLS